MEKEPFSSQVHCITLTAYEVTVWVQLVQDRRYLKVKGQNRKNTFKKFYDLSIDRSSTFTNIHPGDSSCKFLTCNKIQYEIIMEDPDISLRKTKIDIHVQRKILC